MIIAFSIFVKRLKSDFGNVGIMVYIGSGIWFWITNLLENWWLYKKKFNISMRRPKGSSLRISDWQKTPQTSQLIKGVKKGHWKIKRKQFGCKWWHFSEMCCFIIHLSELVWRTCDAVFYRAIKYLMRKSTNW